jgi:MFS family permease
VSAYGGQSAEVMPAATGVAKAWWTVILLSSLYVFSFVDRLVLALLVAPLRSDLGLNDLQLGLLFGPAFGLFYAALGLPLARLADRGNRRRLVTTGVLLWGVATTASGFATSFAILALLRAGLAIGEAALTPSAYSLIGDLFPPHRRKLAASLYTAFGQAGAYGGFIVGAAVLHMMDSVALGSALSSGLKSWQLLFFAVGIPSISLGIVFACTTREPSRGMLQGKTAPRLREVGEYLKRNVRLYLGLFVGAGLLQTVSYSWSAWGPEYVRREFSWPIQRAGLAFGMAGLFATAAGTVILPLIARRLESRGRPDAVALTSMAGVISGSLCALAAVLQSTPIAFLVLLAGSLFCTAGATNNVVISLQTLAPDRMRATLAACVLLCITLFGLCLGPPVTAWIATAISPQGQGLGMALGVLTAGLVIPCMILFSSSRASLRAAPQDVLSYSEGS